MSVRRYGSGGYSVSEPWCLIAPRFNGLFRPILLMHGGGGEETLAEPAAFPTVARVVDRLADFFTLMAPDFRDGISADGSMTWGNDASTTTLSNALAYGQATPALQMAGGKAFLLPTSMGMVAAANFTRRFPSKVAGIAAVSGATDIDYHYANGYAAQIETAYGGNYAVNGAANNPIDFAASLTVPIRMYYAPDDVVVPSSGFGSHVPFLDAYGGATKEAVSMISGGHTAAAWANIDRDDLLRFVSAAAW